MFNEKSLIVAGGYMNYSDCSKEERQHVGTANQRTYMVDYYNYTVEVYNDLEGIWEVIVVKGLNDNPLWSSITVNAGMV